MSLLYPLNLQTFRPPITWQETLVEFLNAHMGWGWHKQEVPILADPSQKWELQMFDNDLIPASIAHARRDDFSFSAIIIANFQL